MTKGALVKMSEELKRIMRGNGSGAHIDEFGDCVGIVQGHVVVNGIKWPEVDVRWLPSNLKYAYPPDLLVRI